MTPARIRIGRVRMKNGGPDLHVIRRSNDGKVAAHMREYVTHVLNRNRAPDAYAAVAVWFDPATPGHPEYSTTYCTQSDAATPAVLVRLAAAQLVSEHAIHEGASRAFDSLGYETEGWTPDDAS